MAVHNGYLWIAYRTGGKGQVDMNRLKDGGYTIVHTNVHVVQDPTLCPSGNKLILSFSDMNS